MDKTKSLFKRFENVTWLLARKWYIFEEVLKNIWAEIKVRHPNPKTFPVIHWCVFVEWCSYKIPNECLLISLAIMKYKVREPKECSRNIFCMIPNSTQILADISIRESFAANKRVWILFFYILTNFGNKNFLLHFLKFLGSVFFRDAKF